MSKKIALLLLSFVCVGIVLCLHAPKQLRISDYIGKGCC